MHVTLTIAYFLGISVCIPLYLITISDTQCPHSLTPTPAAHNTHAHTQHSATQASLLAGWLGFEALMFGRAGASCFWVAEALVSLPSYGHPFAGYAVGRRQRPGRDHPLPKLTPKKKHIHHHCSCCNSHLSTKLSNNTTFYLQ